MAPDDDEPPDSDTNTGIAIPVPVLSQPERKAAYLMVVGAGQASITGRMFKLANREMILGRGAKCDVRIDDEGISRQHAKFTELSPGRYQLVDLKSRNGTFVNGARIEGSELKDGDKIQVGSTAVLVFSLQDELEEEFTQQMFAAATHDGLTRLANKKYFLNAVMHELSFASRYKSPLSMMMIDVDHFKRVNDTYGHQAGDRVLQRVAARLNQLIRKEDMLSRYGGEEFTALLRQADVPAAQICANRCRAGIEELAVKSGTDLIKTTISIGVVTLSGGKQVTAEALFAGADANLYRAKNEGRNRVVVSSML